MNNIIKYKYKNYQSMQKTKSITNTGEPECTEQFFLYTSRKNCIYFSHLRKLSDCMNDQSNVPLAVLRFHLCECSNFVTQMRLATTFIYYQALHLYHLQKAYKSFNFVISALIDFQKLCETIPQSIFGFESVAIEMQF